MYIYMKKENFKKKDKKDLYVVDGRTEKFQIQSSFAVNKNI